jgi:hypothetical protein
MTLPNNNNLKARVAKESPKKVADYKISGLA